MKLSGALWGALILLSGCAKVQVGQHVAAQDYSGSPQRMFIVNNLDDSFDQRLPDGFRSAIESDLARCNVASEVYRPNSMQLDAEAKLAARLSSFKPDTVLLIQQTNRNLVDGEVRAGGYVLILRDVAGKRDIWRGQLGTGASTRWMADRSVVGPKFADQVVRLLAADRVLKSCPPFPAEVGS